MLRGEAANAPSCSGCGRVVCDDCELAGLCSMCVARLWADVADVGDGTLVVVGGCSLPGRRPEVPAQLPVEGADDQAA